MASIRKVGTKWIAEVRIKGQYKSKVHLTKNEAKDWAHTEEHNMNRSKGILRGKCLDDAFKRYLVEETPKKKGARWESIRIKKISRDAIAAMQLTDLAVEDIQGWIKLRQDSGLKGASILRELEILSSVLTKARKWKWLQGNPFEGIERPKACPPRNKIITLDEQKNICSALRYKEDKPAISTTQRIAVAFLLAIETAMRYGEIWKMNGEDIDWGKRFVQLYDTKNGEDRHVDLSARAIQLLHKLNPVAGENVMKTNPKSSEVLFRRAVDLAGYKGIIHFHDTRHTAITIIAPKLKDTLALAKMTGHKDPRQLMTYFNPLPGSMADMLG